MARRPAECGENPCLQPGRVIIKNIRIIAATLLAATTFAAHAQSQDAVAKPWRVGVQLGVVSDHSETDPVVQVTFGYEFNRTFAVEALANVSLLFMRVGSPGVDKHEFDSAIGARALATLPLDERWSAVGGLGVVQFKDDVGISDVGTRTADKTSPMVSAALVYRRSSHWSFGVEVASFTSAHATSASLRSEWHF